MADVTRRQPTQARSRATREAVLDAAAGLAASGADHFTVSAIAAAAGIGTGTLYQYFEGVEAVVEGVVRRHLDRFRHLIEETFADEPFPDAATASLAVTDAFVRYYRERPDFRSLWFGRGYGAKFREIDEANHLVLAHTMYEQLIGQGLVPRSPEAERITLSNWELADSLIGLAFRLHPDGDEATLVYVRHVMRQVCVAPPLDVIVEMMQVGPQAN